MQPRERINWMTFQLINVSACTKLLYMWAEVNEGKILNIARLKSHHVLCHDMFDKCCVYTDKNKYKVKKLPKFFIKK